MLVLKANKNENEVTFKMEDIDSSNIKEIYQYNYPNYSEIDENKVIEVEKIKQKEYKESGYKSFFNKNDEFAKVILNDNSTCILPLSLVEKSEIESLYKVYDII